MEGRRRFDYHGAHRHSQASRTHPDDAGGYALALIDEKVFATCKGMQREAVLCQ